MTHEQQRKREATPEEVEANKAIGYAIADALRIAPTERPTYYLLGKLMREVQDLVSADKSTKDADVYKYYTINDLYLIATGCDELMELLKAIQSSAARAGLSKVMGSGSFQRMEKAVREVLKELHADQD